MLSKAKHLARIVSGSNPSGAVEMLRQAQHDVLFLALSNKEFFTLALAFTAA
jgi:hypothetical protein